MEDTNQSFKNKGVQTDLEVGSVLGNRSDTIIQCKYFKLVLICTKQQLTCTAQVCYLVTLLKKHAYYFACNFDSGKRTVEMGRSSCLRITEDRQRFGYRILEDNIKNIMAKLNKLCCVLFKWKNIRCLVKIELSF